MAARPGPGWRTGIWVATRRPSTSSASGCSGEVLVAGSRDGMLPAAHDLSDGGLALALVESCLRFGHGARVVLPEGGLPWVRIGVVDTDEQDAAGAVRLGRLNSSAV